MYILKTFIYNLLTLYHILTYFAYVDNLFLFRIYFFIKGYIINKDNYRRIDNIIIVIKYSYGRQFDWIFISIILFIHYLHYYIHIITKFLYLL